MSGAAARDAGAAPSPVNGSGVDVVVVGGGPAGLAAATWLARCGRRVRLLDTGEPRNAPTWAVHGYPGIPDEPPHELRRRMRDQALGAGAECGQGEVVEVSGGRDDFRVRLASDEVVGARRLLLAYGRRDTLPDIPRARELYGTSLFHCPDCDGPSMVGEAVGVLGADATAAELALFLSFWAESVVLLPHEQPGEALPEEAKRRLSHYDIPVRPGRIEAVEESAGRLLGLTLEDGQEVELGALFFHSDPAPACELAATLGCACDSAGHLEVDRGQETTVRGVFAAGDIVGHPYLAIAAAAEGVRAALAIHRSLLPEAFRL
ncbi:MAG TPA: NAD(P)/FAD-dependent oxidoreductase [Longimicrobiales bacterium]|nr:NAD(P)/FAD-dependent oxidoreductase [Longimicrobiales bacterium]